MHGLRVIELCEEIGEFAGKLLADMGADVIKIEPPGGSRTRSYAPFLDDLPHPDRSLFFWHYNTSKRSVALDLDGEAGREAFRKLVAGADVLVEDRAPGWLAGRGLDYDDLRGDNPGLIHCAITPFGRSGPRAHDPATDLTILAGAGPAWSCGYDDHSLPPVRGGGNQGYQTGCHWALISILTAVLHRDGGGEGQFIDVSLHAASNVTTEAGSYQWLVARQTVQRQTGRHAGVTPSGPTQEQAKDGTWINTGLFPRRPHEFRILIDWMQELGLFDEYEQSPLLETAAGMDRMLEMARAAEDAEEAALLGAGREAMIFPRAAPRRVRVLLGRAGTRLPGRHHLRARGRDRRPALRGARLPHGGRTPRTGPLVRLPRRAVRLPRLAVGDLAPPTTRGRAHRGGARRTRQRLRTEP